MTTVAPSSTWQRPRPYRALCQMFADASGYDRGSFIRKGIFIFFTFMALLMSVMILWNSWIDFGPTFKAVIYGRSATGVVSHSPNVGSLSIFDWNHETSSYTAYFDLNGTSYSSSSSIMRVAFMPQDGARVEVRYNPQNPKENYIWTAQNNAVISWNIAIAVAIWLCIVSFVLCMSGVIFGVRRTPVVTNA